MPKPAHVYNIDEFPARDYLQQGTLNPLFDPYARNKFNQSASDAIDYRRKVTDSREFA